MDKRSIIGFVLIGVILFAWLYYQNLNSVKEKQKKDEITKQIQQDTNKQLTKKDSVPVKPKTDTVINKVANDTIQYGALFQKFEKGEEKKIIIETDKYYAEFSTKGGSLIKYEVKGFKTWDGYPVQLLYPEKGGELNLLFTSNEGKFIDTKNLYFNSGYTQWQRINLKGNDEYKLVFELPLNDTLGAKIIKTYTFKNGSYIFNMENEFHNPNYFISKFEYQTSWENSLKLTEYRSDVEGNYAESFAYSGGELEIVDASKIDQQYKSDLNGQTDWVCSRIKYFCVALIPKDTKAAGSYITGSRAPLPENGFEENYSIALKNTIKEDNVHKENINVYIGPVDYNILKSYDVGLEKTMRFSLDFIVRPIAQYVILPFFLFIHSFISNWGLVIIIFSIAMKIVLNPFTRYQMKSMKKMSEMQPKMNALKEKYKDDPQKQQQALMRFYKEEKINPMGGCLPLLLQMPILYALFGVFNSTIELRQAYFGLWIKDLAVPDVLFKLPFKIPLFGITEFSGLALLMGITMFLQQKMTVKDPKQAAMVYIMPIMLTLIFMSLPSGLNLYYFVFNLLSIVEQYFVTHRKKTKEGEEVVKPQFDFKKKK